MYDPFDGFNYNNHRVNTNGSVQKDGYTNSKSNDVNLDPKSDILNMYSTNEIIPVKPRKIIATQNDF